MQPSESVPSRRPRPFGLGLTVLVAAFVLDRLHKWWMLGPVDIAYRPPIRVTSFFDLVLVWNQGISYGLFQQDSFFGQLVLVVVHFGAGVLLLVWIWRTPSRLTALAAGLVAGGAIGNGVDRLMWGAVADFFHLHAMGFSWYVFNIADVAIVAGVGVLLYESARPGHKDARKQG